MAFEEMFNEFFARYPRYAKYNLSPVKQVFQKTAETESIANMLKYADLDKPALLGVLDMIETLAQHLEFDFTLKQMCGGWIAYILKDFGYLPAKQKPISKSNYFSSGACYKKTNLAIKELVVIYQISEIKR